MICNCAYCNAIEPEVCTKCEFTLGECDCDKEDDECVCGEINARNCPVHGNSDVGDSDYNERGGYTQAYINHVNKFGT